MMDPGAFFRQGPWPGPEGPPGLPLAQSNPAPELKSPLSGLGPVDQLWDQSHQYQDFTNDRCHQTYATVCGGELNHQLGLQTYLFARYHPQAKANDRDFVSLINIYALNRLLKTLEGRRLYGADVTASQLLEDFRPLGVQQTNTDAPGITQQRVEMAITVAVFNKARVPNVWLACGKHMGPNDHLYFVLRRRPFAQASGFVTQSGGTKKAGEDCYWRWEPYVCRSNEAPSVSAYSSLFGDVVPSGKKKADGSSASTRTSGWVGACLYVGMIQAIYGDPNPDAWATVAEQALYGDDADGGYKQLLHKLPGLEIMLGSPARGF
jgi:hypothetical protein